MSPLFYLFFFLIGLCIGSFLNVVIDRLPNGETIAKGRSHCDFCKKKLKWFDLIPLLSFISLKGECRYCKKKLSWQYPLIELITGLFFVFTYTYVLYYYSHAQFFPYVLILDLFLVSSFISIFFIDLKYGLIPDKILILIFLFSVLFQIFFTRQLVFGNLLSGVGAFAFFLLLYLFTKRKGMGFGDVKLAFLIGFLVGFPNVIVSLYMAFLTGAFISIILILWGKKRFSNTIPFGPFLVSSLIVVYFYGDAITKIGMKLLGF